MGGVGPAFGNVVAERFFVTLKTALAYRRSWRTRLEFEIEILFCFGGFCNSRRCHSRLGSLSPTGYEQQLVIKARASA